MAEEGIIQWGRCPQAVHMADKSLRVNIAVNDRILLHLLEQDHLADRYIVTAGITRPGIAEACALHPPNVSRAMRDLLRADLVSEHSRQVRGDNRRQKTWQLTDAGRDEMRTRLQTLRTTNVLIRDKQSDLLEVPASEAAERLDSSLTLLQVLMLTMVEGILQYGDIRLGHIERGEDDLPPPGRLLMLAGAHSTYHIRAPGTRTVHGRESERAQLDEWFAGNEPCMVISGIAGCGKTTLASDWLNARLDEESNLRVMYYPCQPWDSALGLATSLLHRLGIDSKGETPWDPYGILESLPLTPGGKFDIDLYRRRLTAYMTDPEKLRERVFEEYEDVSDKPPYILLVLDDVHNIEADATHLLGALMQVATQSPLRMMLLSRTQLSFYDRRDVHTRDLVSELTLSGLTLEECELWLATLDVTDPPDAAEVHRLTGGHPLALELLEMYGSVVHGDWMRFLDEEILDVLPAEHRDLLAYLAVATRPVPWPVLAEAAGLEGEPPKVLLERGLVVELADGLWLHEAMRERLLREVGEAVDERKAKLEAAHEA